MENLENVYQSDFTNCVKQLQEIQIRVKDITVSNNKMYLITSKGEAWGLGLNENFQICSSIKQKFGKPVLVAPDIGPNSTERNLKISENK